MTYNSTEALSLQKLVLSIFSDIDDHFKFTIKDLAL